MSLVEEVKGIMRKHKVAWDEATAKEFGDPVLDGPEEDAYYDELKEKGIITTDVEAIADDVCYFFWNKMGEENAKICFDYCIVNEVIFIRKLP